jgi:hypothetical protein
MAERLPFVPSLEWWAARELANHIHYCALIECDICALPDVTDAARARINNALRGTDALQWVGVAATHEHTDYEKAAVIASWIYAERGGDLITLSSALPITFVLEGEQINTQLLTSEDGRKSIMWRRNLFSLVQPCTKLRRVHTSVNTKHFAGVDNMDAYTLYQCNPKQRLLLRTLLENGLLRLSWLPVEKVRRCWCDCPPILVDYAECELPQLNRVVPERRHISTCIGQH